LIPPEIGKVCNADVLDFDDSVPYGVSSSRGGKEEVRCAVDFKGGFLLVFNLSSILLYTMGNNDLQPPRLK